MSDIRTKIDKVIEYSNIEFDKSIIFIASGALSISMAFINDIVKIDTAVYTDLLVAAWFCFATTIFLSLICHYVSMQINRWIAENYPDAANEADTLKEKNEKEEQYEIFYHEAIRRNKRIKWLNLSMIIILFAGLLLFLLFIQSNISKPTMSEEINKGQNQGQNRPQPEVVRPNHIGDPHGAGEKIRKGMEGPVLPKPRPKTDK